MTSICARIKDNSTDSKIEQVNETIKTTLTAVRSSSMDDSRYSDTSLQIGCGLNSQPEGCGRPVRLPLATPFEELKCAAG
jgi:hypothetical protein